MEINLKATETRKEVLGEKHPDYLTSLNNLAQTYSALGDLHKAFGIFQQVVKKQKEILGEKHPDFLTCLNNLAITEFKLSEFTLAMDHKLKVTNEI